MIFVDELTIPLVLFQKRKNETGLLLCGLSQYAENGARHSYTDHGVNQNANTLLRACISIKQREANSQRQHLQDEETSLIRISADCVPNRKTGNLVTADRNRLHKRKR